MTTQIKFRPWKGANYEDGSQDLRILVLGESQYTSDHFDNPVNFTIERVQEYIGGGCKGKFWTNIAQALIGRGLVLEERRQFWNSVSFYNYVQEFLAGPRLAPSEKAWETGPAAFEEVLEELKPGFILVLGSRLWEHMPCSNADKGSKIEGAWDPQTWIYSYSSGNALAYCVRHPSSAFSALTEHQYILVAINEARKLNQGSR